MNVDNILNYRLQKQKLFKPYKVQYSILLIVILIVCLFHVRLILFSRIKTKSR